MTATPSYDCVISLLCVFFKIGFISDNIVDVNNYALCPSRFKTPQKRSTGWRYTMTNWNIKNISSFIDNYRNELRSYYFK